MPKPFDNTPEQWHKGSLPYKPGLTLVLAKKILDAGEKEAENYGVPMVMAITDGSCHLAAFRRMEPKR